MRKRLRRSDEEAQINVTPMLDIIFIMLIFFIVTTSFVSEFGVDMSRPTNVPVEQQEPSEVIVVRMEQNDRIFVQGRLVDIRSLRASIESGLAVQPDAAVVIVADRLTAAGLVVRVVDQARAAGAARVSLAAQAP